MIAGVERAYLTPQQISLPCRAVCLRRRGWFTVWTLSQLGPESKRGPGLTAGPRCVHCALVKVHMSWMVEKPNGCRNKSNRDVDGLKAGRRQRFSSRLSSFENK